MFNHGLYNNCKMPTPQEFTMNYNFKLVYTDVLYNVQISSHSTLEQLFSMASVLFEQHIDYDKYYIDYVVCGQEKVEMASAISHHNLDHPLYYEFGGEKWKQVSFYVRPMSRITDRFVRMDTYNLPILGGNEAMIHPLESN